jgi:metal-sulfur cluster biosynthetic enzyme
MTEADVRHALRHVVDPELGINIIDLGLVYRVDIDGTSARITMAMTSPACPLREYLGDLVKAAIRSHVAGAQSVVVDIVTEPPWTVDRMSDAARRQLE